MVEEKDLIKKAQNGDREAFCTLMEAHESKIYALSFKYMQNTHDASDAAQDAMLKIFLNIGKFRSDAAFSTWVYRIVANTCVDLLRRKKTLVPLENYESKSPYANPDEDLISAEFMTGLKQAVADLPSDFKSVLVLKDLEHQKYEDIARILQISEGTVKSRLSRAREKLRRMMEARQLL